MVESLLVAVLKALVAHAEKGATADTLAEMAGCKKVQVYNTMNAIRTRKKIPVKTKGDLYFIDQKKAEECLSDPTNFRATPKRAGNASKGKPMAKNLLELAVPVLKNIHRLPPGKREDFVELLSKADFYYRCARSMIESCMATETLFTEA